MDLQELQEAMVGAEGHREVAGQRGALVVVGLRLAPSAQEVTAVLLLLVVVEVVDTMVEVEAPLVVEVGVPLLLQLELHHLGIISLQLVMVQLP